MPKRINFRAGILELKNEANIMKIQEIEIEKLKPYENNPRKNDNAIEGVAKSIESYGFNVPIAIDSNFEIICGYKT
ncbi:MAG: ParB N-terminal domain-containing protein [Oscillospiraceae bacterium]|nr:ParB N-terminal domain-containing protein [Oscillospiraceae bacterium]